MKQKVSEIALAPFADGRFEVYVDGKRIHSKLGTGSFPDIPTLVARVRKMA